MKIVIAPDSFKESLTALEACNSIEEGMKIVFPDAEYVKVPMADGGEGLKDHTNIGMHPKLKDATIRVACGVDNPLTGKKGCVFDLRSPKGGTSNHLEQLYNYEHFSEVIRRYMKKHL